MKKMNQWVLAAALIGGLTSCMSCTTNKDNAPSVEAAEYPPFKDLINVGASIVANPGSTVSALRRTSL